LIPGYQSYYSKIKRNQNDGIIIYVKYGLNVNFFEYEYIDANIIKVTLKTDELSLSLLCIYRSPSGSKHEFLTILNNLIITLNSSNEKIIIIGDVNLNIIGVDNVNNEYLDIMSENGFKSFINVYTRTPVGMKHSCLDHIFFKMKKILTSK